MVKTIIATIFIVIIYVSCLQTRMSNSSTSLEKENGSSHSNTQINNIRVAVLNELRNEIITTYGCIDGGSRVNRGPCGRFAKTFREEWNLRFKDTVNIVFIMNSDGIECYHILVRLPDKYLFDAGLGVVSDSALHLIVKDTRFEDMTNFDYQLLDKRAYGLNRSYPNCPNYSDDLTKSMLQRYFNKLSIQINGRQNRQ